jgi:hypothetical protein
VAGEQWQAHLPPSEGRGVGGRYGPGRAAAVGCRKRESAGGLRH